MTTMTPLKKCKFIFYILLFCWIWVALIVTITLLSETCTSYNTCDDTLYFRRGNRTLARPRSPHAGCRSGYKCSATTNMIIGLCWAVLVIWAIILMLITCKTYKNRGNNHITTSAANSSSNTSPPIPLNTVTSNRITQMGVLRFLDNTALCRPVVDADTLDYISRLFHNDWRFNITGYGLDAGGLAYQAVQVRNVYHLHNRELMTRYEEEHAKVKDKFQLASALDLIGRPIATSLVKPNFSASASTELPILDPTPKQRCMLQDDEVFLFHGTDYQTVQSIIQSGFSLEHAKRGIYGHPAIYLSELAQKADQYTDQRSGRRRFTDLYIFVVRVVLGKTVMYLDKQNSPVFDTVVGGSNKLFREFVKTNVRQIHPEFLINYERIRREVV